MEKRTIEFVLAARTGAAFHYAILVSLTTDRIPTKRLLACLRPSTATVAFCIGNYDFHGSDFTADFQEVKPERESRKEELATCSLFAVARFIKI